MDNRASVQASYFEEIEANNFNLNIPRYVDTFEPEETVDLRAVNQQITDLKAQLADVEERMAAYLRELGLDE
jgi:type I restriction enzyme M protein